jgi:hypothetical protein
MPCIASSSLYCIMPRAQSHYVVRVKEDEWVYNLPFVERGERGRSKLEVATHSIVEASATFQVPVKGIRDIKHTFDMFHAERFPFVDCERLGGADGVLDLSV